MPTSATPKQVFDRVLWNELKSLTQKQAPKSQSVPSWRRRESEEQQQNSESGKAANYPPWRGDASAKPGRRRMQGGRAPQVQQQGPDREHMRKEMIYQLARDARLEGARKPAEESMDGKITAPKPSPSGWDAIMEEATTESRNVGRGGQRGGRGGKKAEKSGARSLFGAPGDSGDSAGDWHAMMVATQGRNKVADGPNGRKVNGTRSREAAPVESWEKAYSRDTGSRKPSPRKRSRNNRKRSGGGKKGGDAATEGFDWGRFYS